MLSHSRAHLSDHAVLRDLAAATTKDKATSAELLALIGEADKRGLHRAQGYASLSGYLIEKLGMPEDMVYKRIGAARVARRYPHVLAMVADGRLHLTAILKLRPHLTTENADELFAAAVGKTRDGVDLVLAERFPQADVPTTLVPLGPATIQPAPAIAQEALLASALDVQASPSLGASPSSITSVSSSLAPERVAPEKSVPIAVSMVPPAPQRRVAPLSPGRYELRLTISQSLHDKIKRAEELLGHAVPSGDIPQLLERALDELIARKEKLHFAATDRPRNRLVSKNPRCIPARVKRAVRTRDHGQCTYVAHDGHRCEARKFLEYDHKLPVARGGTSTVDNIRLRCRAHNQLEAERVFGAGFMEEKRQRGSASRELN